MADGSRTCDILLCFQELNSKMKRLVDPIIQEEGLSLMQLMVLLTLDRDSLSVCALNEQTMMGQANTSTLCKKMERSGLITRCRSSEDRRVVLLSLTEKGKETAAHVQEKVSRYMEVLEEIPDQTIEEMVCGIIAVKQILDHIHDQTKGDVKPC